MSTEVRCAAGCGESILWGPAATQEEIEDGRCRDCVAAKKPRRDAIADVIEKVRDWGLWGMTLYGIAARAIWCLERHPSLGRLPTREDVRAVLDASVQVPADVLELCLEKYFPTAKPAEEGSAAA